MTSPKRERLRKDVRKVVYWLGVILAFMLVLLVVSIGLSALLVVTGNSDYQASTVESRTLGGIPGHAGAWVDIAIISLNEATNTAQISITATIPKDQAQGFRSGEDAFTLDIVSAANEESDRNLTRVVLDKDTPVGPHGDLTTAEATASLVMYREVNPYPFDDYEAAIAIEGPKNIKRRMEYYSFNTRVRKLLAGRHLVAGGTYDEVQIRLRRPRLQQTFVLGGAAVFFVIVIGTAVMLLRAPVDQSQPHTVALSVAGFLLGAAGFRDLMGFPKLTSFSFLEALVVGVPLALLSAVFLRIAVTSFLNKTQI